MTPNESQYWSWNEEVYEINKDKVWDYKLIFIKDLAISNPTFFYMNNDFFFLKNPGILFKKQLNTVESKNLLLPLNN